MDSTQSISENQLIDQALAEAKTLRFGAKIFLMNGVKIEAGLVDFDGKNLLITGLHGGLTLIYRSAISSFATTSRQVDIPVFQRNNNDLEKDFFNACKPHAKLKLYLLNSICLKGQVGGADDASVILTSPLNSQTPVQIVNKSALATIAQDMAIQ